MSDFPRGWTLSSAVSGAGTASITVAAIAGVVHVLDSFDAKLANLSNAALQSLSVVLNSSDGVFVNFILGGTSVPANSGVDTASGTGLDLAAGPGASLTIAFNGAAAAGVVQTLVIQGHDI